MGALLANDYNRAEAALATIERELTAALNQVPPGCTQPVSAKPGTHLEVFNDSIFLYVQDLIDAVHCASVAAYRLMRVSRERGGPIAVRGAIARVDRPPTVVRRQHAEPCSISTTRLVADNLTAALVAEKRRVLGGRILVDEALVLEHWARWSGRMQARLMAVGRMPDGIRPDILESPRELRNHVDIAWMNVESEEKFAALAEPLQRMQFNAAFSQRAALHAAATMAMYRLTQTRRNGLVVIIKQHWPAARKVLGVSKASGRTSYQEWLGTLPKIELALKKRIMLPYDMAALRALPK